MAPAVLVGVVALGLGCGGDSSSPVVPGALVPTGGDGQMWPTGTTLPVPLGVAVTGSDGRPFPGATVTWTVTAGAATFAPPSSTTDAAGAASTTVTLGGQIGPVTVQANVVGVTSATFNATALDPCTYLWAYTFGATVSGTLATTDCLFNGPYYTDFYRLDLPSGQQGLTIATSSTAFDTWVDLYPLSGLIVAFSDNVDTVSNRAELHAIVAPGSYVLAPNSLRSQVTGPYAVSAVTRPQTLAGCELVWVTRGITVSDQVTASDCVDNTSNFFDIVAIFALQGSVLRIAQRSSALNAKLTVLDDTGATLASNDDSLPGTTTDAYIAFSVPQTGPYIVFIGSSAPNETGAYTFEVSAATTLAQGTTTAPPEPMRFTMPRLAKGWPPGVWRSRPPGR